MKPLRFARLFVIFISTMVLAQSNPVLPIQAKSSEPYLENSFDLAATIGEDLLGRGSVPACTGVPGPLLHTTYCSCKNGVCICPGIGAVGTANPQGTVAEPVSTGNGDYFYQHADFSIPGRGPQLLFQRAYNSLDSYSGPLGTNWTHSYNILLTNNSSTIDIKWGDGHIDVYTLSGSNYVPPAGVFSTLIANSDGTFAVTQKDQTQYNFTSAGVLSSIVDKNGNQILFTYAGGNLTQITDTVGRVFTLAYNSSNQLITITDAIGRTESFTYSATNDLATVTDPLKGVTTYAYDTSHHITTITLPGNTSS